MHEEAILSEREKESLKFLERDFNQCFQQMRHIDERMFNILKFMFSADTLLIGIALGLYKSDFFKKDDFIFSVLFILFIGWVVGLFMFRLAIRNRGYYVKIARYVNEQRGLFLNLVPNDLKIKTDFYSNKTKPLYFNWGSLQVWLIFLIAFLNSMLLGVMILLKSNICVAALLGAVFFVLLGTYAICYLKSGDKRN